MSQTAIPVPTEHKIVYLQNITAWANKNHPYLVNAKLKFAALIPPSMVCCACFVADLKGRTLWHGHVVGGALCLHIPALVSWQRGHKTGGKNSGAALGRYFTRRHPWLGHNPVTTSHHTPPTIFIKYFWFYFFMTPWAVLLLCWLANMVSRTAAI